MRGFEWRGAYIRLGWRGEEIWCSYDYEVMGAWRGVSRRRRGTVEPVDVTERRCQRRSRNWQLAIGRGRLVSGRSGIPLAQ